MLTSAIVWESLVKKETEVQEYIGVRPTNYFPSLPVRTNGAANSQSSQLNFLNWVNVSGKKKKLAQVPENGKSHVLH